MTEWQRVSIGTRRSDLARWQANDIARQLREVYPDLAVTIEVINTRGDLVLDTPLPLLGGKGLFTTELETALRDGTIDLAVHSLKDLPTDDPDGLIVGAVPERAAVNDVLISQDDGRLDDLPSGSTIGTSSRRRAAQIVAYRPDLQIADIRGNVPTRIEKARNPDGPYDATLLAQAGLERLGMLNTAHEILPLNLMLPAPGQGALAVQCRDEARSRLLLAPLQHQPTNLAVTAERAFLAALGGGCAVPIAAYAFVADGVLHMTGRVCALDGSMRVEVSGKTRVEESDGVKAALVLGADLAAEAEDQGAKAILEALP